MAISKNSTYINTTDAPVAAVFEDPLSGNIFQGNFTDSDGLKWKYWILVVVIIIGVVVIVITKSVRRVLESSYACCIGVIIIIIIHKLVVVAVVIVGDVSISVCAVGVLL